MEVIVEESEIMLIEKIRGVREKNEEVVRVIKEIKKVKVRNSKSEKWKIEKDLVLKKGKIYVLKNEELRMEIILSHHNCYELKTSVKSKE